MDVSIPNFYIERKTIKAAKWGTPIKHKKRKLGIVTVCNFF
jgi:hypothetical protein